MNITPPMSRKHALCQVCEEKVSIRSFSLVRWLFMVSRLPEQEKMEQLNHSVSMDALKALAESLCSGG